MKEKKKCTRCNRTKGLHLFYKAKRNKDGYQTYCKSCSKKRVNEQNNTPEGKARVAAKNRNSRGYSGEFKVYIVTSVAEQKFYIGFTNRTGKALDNYFGSNKESSSWPDREKTILFETERKSEAKFVELFLQICYRTDEHCVNDMLNIRTRGSHLKGLTDDNIFEVREATSRVLQMWKQRCRGNLLGRTDPLLQLQLYLQEPEGEC